MLIGIHRHLANVTAPRSAERAIEITASLIDLARITTKHTSKRPTICFDEWNVWDEEKAPGHLGGEQEYNLSDALGLAAWCNVFVRQSRYLGMANIAQSVNVLSPLLTTERGVIKQTLYWPLYLFSKYMRGKTLAVHVRSGEYDGRTAPEWIASTCDTPWLDVSAALSDDGFISLAVINISDEKDFATELLGVGKDVQAFVVGANCKSVRVTNKEGVQNVGIVESKWDGQGRYTFPKHSFTLLRWKAVDWSRTNGV
jgi:alpha-N-arabinofuranosidase